MPNSEHYRPGRTLSENERKLKIRDKYLDLVRELKKAIEHEVDSDTNSN